MNMKLEIIKLYPNKFFPLTDCTQCPCKNSDYDSGCECNNDFEMDLFWDKNGNLLWCSWDCKLVKIINENSEFDKPELVFVRKNRVEGVKDELKRSGKFSI